VKKISLLTLTLAFTVASSIHAAPKIGSDRQAPHAAVLSVQDHFSLGMKAIAEEDWIGAEREMRTVILNFPSSAFTREARYFVAVALFKQEEFDRASQQFRDYLDHERSPKHLEEVFEYKLAIANCFAAGARRRPFGYTRLPKLLSARTEALDLYDEIIATLPSHSLAAEALFAEAKLLADLKEFNEAIEKLQILIGRFPRHSQTPQAYLSIGELYLQLSRQQQHDPDLLALAMINVRKFRQDFPTDERLIQAEGALVEMREVYAGGLIETGRFYERTKKPQAAVIYYRTAVRDYPSTEAARRAEERLAKLDGL
jgi:outer membrane assembly lipoprotein YfiO